MLEENMNVSERETTMVSETVAETETKDEVQTGKPTKNVKSVGKKGNKRKLMFYC